MTGKAPRKPKGCSFYHEDIAAMPCCGIDEVGRGPLAGPVVAAAVQLDRANIPKTLVRRINDSKKLRPADRREIAAALRDYADIGIGLCTVEDIDRINILQATMEAMRRAYAGLAASPALALVDGNRKPGLPCDVQLIVGGDAASLSIASASIVAKVYRDDIMAELAETFPQYGWTTNAGYGTAAHLEAIELYGVTIHHRRSFAPVAKQLVKVNSVNN